MSEKTISRSGAAALRVRINQAIEHIERGGFEREHVVAAMLGVAGGILASTSGRAECLAVLDAVKDAMFSATSN